MQMRAEIQLISMMKSMTDVVIPAIDSSNMLAQEQGKLVVGMLNLMREQLPMQFRFDRDELQRLLATTAELKALSLPPGDELQVLQAYGETAQETLAQCALDPSLLQQSIEQLRHAIAMLVKGLSSTAELDVQLAVEKIILKMSSEQLLRDRALMLPQGWEHDTSAIPSLDALLAPLA